MSTPGLYSEPWAITEDALKLVVAVASRDRFFADVREQALEARNGRPMQNTHEVTVRDGVAIIPVLGPLFRHANLFTELSGATAYATLRKDLQAALDDPGIRAVLLMIDSPGGEANGCSELAGAIYEARGQKPIKAYVGGAGCSAAYWIASACDEMVIADTAIIGSIGVRMAVLRETEKERAARVEFVSSQSPNKRMDVEDDADRARLQRRIDALADVFVDTVARNRGVTREVVLERFGQGDSLVGAHAVTAGLADRIGNFEAVLAELASPKRGENGMSIKLAMALGLPEGATEEQVLERVKTLAKFQADTCAALGVPGADEARGALKAAADALRAEPGLRKDLADTKATLIRRDLRATLERGLHERRLSLGMIQADLPLFVANEETRAAMQAAFADLSETTKDKVLDAACSVQISDAELRTVQAWSARKAPTVAEPVTPPTRRDREDAAQLNELEREMAESVGMDEETVSKFSGVRSADDLKKTKKAPASAAREEG